MRLLRLASVLAVLAVLAPVGAQANTLLQAGPWLPGHVPMYSSSGNSQSVVQDGGPAGGGAPGVNPSELGLTIRGAGTPPYANAGTGPNGSNFCDYDGPITGAFHYLCLSPNAGGGGLISYGAGNGASALPLYVLLNGTKYQFPFSSGGVQGPVSSTVGDVALWNNASGTLLSDAGFGVPFPVTVGGTGGTTPAAARTNLNIIAQVSTTATLQALSLTGMSSGVAVLKTGYYTANDMSPATYALSTSACSLNAGAGDGGSQIPSSTAGNCWLLAANPVYNARWWGAEGSASTTTGTTSASSGAVTLAAASDFLTGEPIAIIGAGTANSAGVPTSLALTNENNSGALLQYCARLVGIDADHGFSAASTEVCVTYSSALALPTSSAALSAMKSSWTAATGDDAVAVYAGTTGAETCKFVQAVSGGLSRLDYGQSSECPSWLPSSPPSSAQADMLRATITAGGGTTAVTISPVSTSAVTGGIVEHDDTVPLQNAVAAVLAVQLPCGTFGLTQALALSRADNQALVGQGFCSILRADGDFNIVSLSGTAWNNQSIGNFLIDASGMDGGFAVDVNGSNNTNVLPITINSPYNETEITNSFGGQIWSITGQTRRRGDLGLYMHGATNNLQAGLQNISWYNGAQAYQGVSFYGSGCMDSLRGIHIGLQRAPAPQLLLDNAVGCSAPPRYPHIRELGINNAWSPPPNTATVSGAVSGTGSQVQLTVSSTTTLNQGGELVVTGVTGTTEANGTWQFTVVDGTHVLLLGSTFANAYVSGGAISNYLPAVDILAGIDVEFANSYIQYLGPSGTGDGVFVANGVTQWQFTDGQIFAAGWNGLTDQAMGGEIHGTRIFNNSNASVECGSQAIGLDINGAGDLNYITKANTSAQTYGVVLDAGCQSPVVEGRWLGNVANVLDQTSPSTPVFIAGVPSGSPPTSVRNATGSVTLSAASFPNLYSSSGCAVLDATGFSSGPTYTTDTATNIEAQLVPSAQVGDKFCIVIQNHRNFAITITGGTGVTTSGTASVPANGLSNAVSFRRFIGQVTNTGTPAVSLKGCSLTAGTQC